MSVTKENVKYLPKRVRIIQDSDACNPRKEYDHVGKMVCWHRRYDLGDEQPSLEPTEWLRQLAADFVGKGYDADDIPAEHIQRIIDKHFIILPIYLYDHSGIMISCAPFHCPWDSGQVGYIYCEKAKGVAECGDVEKAENCLRCEVKEYDNYLTGSVYGCVVEALDYETGQHEQVDSCWGFNGDDIEENGIAEFLRGIGEQELVEQARKAEVEYDR